MAIKPINPWSFQMEITEGCNRFCAFCGIRSIRTAKDRHIHKFMDIDLFSRITRQINEWRPTSRIEFNNHGEPCLHPAWIEMLEIARRNMPYISLQLQTNMHVAFDHIDPVMYIKEHFDHGLNIFVANCYKQEFYDQMSLWRGTGYLQAVLGSNVQIIDYYYDKMDKKPSPYANHSGEKMLFIMDDLGRAQKVIGSFGRSKMILNEGGNTPEQYMIRHCGRGYPTEPMKAPCSRVFREMTFGWDGVVPICCYDWKNAFVMGDANSTPLEEIWNGEAWGLIRSLLGNAGRERNFSPCDICDYNGGFRLGLLPDVPAIHFQSTIDQLVDHMKKHSHFQYPQYDYHIGGRIYNGPSVRVDACD